MTCAFHKFASSSCLVFRFPTGKSDLTFLHGLGRARLRDSLPKLPCQFHRCNYTSHRYDGRQHRPTTHCHQRGLCQIRQERDYASSHHSENRLGRNGRRQSKMSSGLNRRSALQLDPRTPESCLIPLILSHAALVNAAVNRKVIAIKTGSYRLSRPIPFRLVHANNAAKA